ncbi:carbohydrate kinase family protein [Aureimonas jatrophae]|uniref:Fructokinase n=1 Tax=Aureimonas jatrophae TaxID=1166073 RepID=A0A1H0FLN3_9HYPH|nr:carbohydrate kinase [Aureimonas jatrophae]MBB3949963.1 fructokinase [Aureimonas jatrophae]SDN95421.1 fructokinase [Aureimonas jatrophae]
MTKTILCCGEALIDFVPVALREEGAGYRPCPGGSPYNVARALGRLDVPTGFLGGISADFFGETLVEGLRESGVDTRWVERRRAPSTLGFVSLDTAEPDYAFYDAQAADRAWTNVPDETALRDVGCLHFGSISLIREPAAAAYETLLHREARGARLVTFDPNIRPSLVVDEAAYRDRMARILARADIVKISAADLDWLHPGLAPDAVAERWLGQGAALVAVTFGERGVAGFARGRRLSIDAIPTTVVDTVGAGDSFMAGLLAGLHDQGLLDRAGLDGADESALAAALTLGQRVASATCKRRGADAPRRAVL